VARTKIVCTIGPASRSRETLARLAEAGMDVARLNFSHGTQAEHAEVVSTLRSVSEEAGRPIAILQDLSGVKIRIGEIACGAVRLEPGGAFILTSRPVPGDASEVSVSVPDLSGSVAAGDALLLSDGELQLRVEETTATDVRCRVLAGGWLAPHKGISLPRSRSAPGLTSKDRDDLRFGAAQGVDYVALSFVRSAEDLREARGALTALSAAIPIIAKIENPDALAHIDEILEESDGIMVARGDLGVETPLEHVPLLQKMLIEKSNRAGKPVITATQMLLSMVENPRPTRAEVGDVANAIFDGTDAVMLSEETAAGRYPSEAAATMQRIARETESAFPFEQWIRRFEDRRLQSLPEAVAGAACELAEHIGAAVIVAWTEAGATARLVAKHRPRCPVLALCTSAATARRLALVWGVIPLVVEGSENTDAMMDKAPALAAARGLARPGDKVVITAGVPRGVSGSTNLIKATVVPP